MSISVAKPATASLNDYISIARPDHWFKNIFMVPGMVMAYMYYRVDINLNFILQLLAAIVSTCFIASANYVINEWLDAEFDKHHPVKKNRPSVVKSLNPKVVYLEYVLFAVAGLLPIVIASSTITFQTIKALIVNPVKSLRSE